jgi:two-component system, cell cycle response regulator
MLDQREFRVEEYDPAQEAYSRCALEPSAMTKHKSRSAPAHTTARRQHESRQVADEQSQSLSILVVADDTALFGVVESLLGARVARVVGARSAFMAKEALAEESFPIVIIDRGLQDEDGIGLCTEIRAHNEPADVYLILWTARDSTHDVAAGLQAGADDYLSKRASDAELVARLNTACRVMRLERALRKANTERVEPATTEVASPAQAGTALLRRIGSDLDQACTAQSPLSVLAMDIDFFKAVNDRHGHVAGDELLRHLANRVRFALPQDEDWVARIGEEFVVALPGADIQKAVEIAEHLRRTVEATPFHVAGSDVSITVSIGVGSHSTLSPDEEPGAQALLDQADRYLYRSKLAGRNLVSAASDRPLVSRRRVDAGASETPDVQK